VTGRVSGGEVDRCHPALRNMGKKDVCPLGGRRGGEAQTVTETGGVREGRKAHQNDEGEMSGRGRRKPAKEFKVSA